MSPIVRRAFILLVLVCVLAPITLYVGYWIRQPTLWAGDRVEIRDCRWCDGSGRDQAMALEMPELGDRCAACGGTGRVRVILPGPERPARLRGAVVDARSVDRLLDGYQTVRPVLGPAAMRARRGGGSARRLAGARLELSSPTRDSIRIEVNDLGLFNERVPPGKWTARVEVEGFAPLELEFEVPEQTEPIWLEEARIITEPASAEAALGTHGLEALFALVPRGADEEEAWSRLQVGTGAP